MKKYSIICLFICAAVLLTGCNIFGKANNSGYDKYSYEFLGTFDTVVQIMGYAKTQKEFEDMASIAKKRFEELNKLYDVYNNYDGINNIKTINDNAGIKPVEVSQEIIDLILFSKEWYYKTNRKCNIALGSMLYIWHEYRDAGISDPENAKLPPMDDLKKAMEHTDIEKVIVNEQNKTVFLADKDMRLDVGAVAKGFASEIVVQELMEKGYTGFIISSGGNVRTVGKPLDGVRIKWGIGIQNPDGNALDPNDPPLDIVFLTDKSVVTSGDYQRYYIVDGKKYHHLIDPETLMPADYFRSVVAIVEDSGLADFMSTTLYLTPFDEGYELAQSLGIEAVWIMNDGTIKATPGAEKIMKSKGATATE
ncbi:MAG: FAD:protein FMN transferase [Clostridiaceae bacterium]|nr:FAD:protein FMN transferase [Clostridiaceae bacterium]